MTFPINYLKYLISPSPSILKPAKVIPVHKKDSKLDFSNYHPISLLSNIENFLERLMYNRMYKFFSDNNLIYSLQFGFRQKYSTVHAVNSLAENIRKNLDEGNISCDIFVDFQKTFDTIEHDIILSKLEHYHSVHCQGIIKTKMEVGIQFWVTNFGLSPKYPKLLFRNEELQLPSNQLAGQVPYQIKIKIWEENHCFKE